MIFDTKFRCRNSLWNEARDSRLGKEFITIARPVSYSFIKKHGQMVTAIDVKPHELPTRVLRALLGRQAND